MREALKIKEKLGLTWREVAFQGLGMIVEQRPIGRPPKQEKPKLTPKEEADEEKLKKKIKDIALEAFRDIAIWREFLPLIRVGGIGYKYYRYFRETSGETTIDMNGMTTSVYKEEEVKIPIISRTFQVYRNGRIDSTTIREAATEMAVEEGKLILVGEYEGWAALGIKGMLGTEGINTIASCGRWPETVFQDIINIRNNFKPKNPIILIAPSKIINSLKQPMWEDPYERQPPVTYLNFIREQKVVSDIYETDSVHALDGTQNTAIIFTPSKENAWMVEALEVTPYTWNDKNGETLCTLREAITPAIGKPSSITQITNIIV